MQAKVNNKSSMTPLMLATREGHVEVHHACRKSCGLSVFVPLYNIIASTLECSSAS